jgi:hypothetical protein
MVNLHDSEVIEAYRIAESLTARFGRRTWTGEDGFSKLADELEKESTEAFAKIGLIAHMDATPMLAGEPPQLTVVARAPGNEFDHERHSRDVRLAQERGERVLGERG